MIALLLFALSQNPAARAALAQVEISGPCAAISIELEGAGRAQLDLAKPLLVGERRRMSIAVPLPCERLPQDVWSRAVAQAIDATGNARLVELSPALELENVGRELLTRPRPVLDARAARVPWSGLFVLGAAFAITLSQRRKTWTVTAIALLACGSVYALSSGMRSETIASLRIIEARFDAAQGEPWLEVLASRDRLEPVDLANARIEVQPPRSDVAARTRGEPPLIALESPGATFFQLRAFDASARRLSREFNALGRFDEAWLREADGPWLRFGPWLRGEALPRPGPGEPPGWIVPALPMGTSIFVGRLAEEGVSGEHRTTTWVRGLGL